MIKKWIIENIYFFFILFILSLFAYFNLNSMDNVVSEGNSMFVVFFTMLLFIFSIPYIVVLFKDLFTNHILGIGKVIFFFSLFYFFIFFSTLLFSDSHLSRIGVMFLLIKSVLPFIVLLVAYLYVKRNGVTYGLDVGILFLFIVLVYGYVSLFNIANTLDGGHIGVAYWVLWILPLIMVGKFKICRYISIFIVLLVLFSSIKRAGIVAFTLSFLVYLYYKFRGNNQNAFVNVLFGGIIISFFVYLFYILGTSGDNYIFERFENIAEDEGSGRLDVWKETIHLISQSDLMGLLFGHGDNAVLRDSTLFLSAHNDFLEILYDYGFFAFLVFFYIIFLLLRMANKLVERKSVYLPALFQLFVIVFVLMCISHVVIYPWMVLVCFSLGAFFALIEREQLNINNY